MAGPTNAFSYRSSPTPRLKKSGRSVAPTTANGFKENKRHRVSIHYAVGPDQTQKTPFYITMTNKATGAEAMHRIDTFDLLWVAYSFGKIKLTDTIVEIQGGGGERGAVILFAGLSYGRQYGRKQFITYLVPAACLLHK